MTPEQVKSLRTEIELTVDEFAFALNITPSELRRIEAGESDYCHCAAFREAFEALEQRVMSLLVGV
ncbi:MAG TPA: helix-turn-helix domain-containing protein [Thermoanaerobaculia bacterium]|nr:helix-turn-helix domain-containing protein [Thermoanaerobaculia bacterium]